MNKCELYVIISWNYFNIMRIENDRINVYVLVTLSVTLIICHRVVIGTYWNEFQGRYPLK